MLYKSNRRRYPFRTYLFLGFLFFLNFNYFVMCKTEIMAFVREAEVSTLSTERELAFVEALCDLGNLADARNFLRLYMEKTSQFYLKCLEFMLEHNSTLFTYALAMSRGGWHRRYKNKKYLVRGTDDDVLTLQKDLLNEKLNIRILFTYAVSYNVELMPEVLEEVKHRAEKEAHDKGISLQQQMTEKSVSYASIYNHQIHKLDKMRSKRA